MGKILPVPFIEQTAEWPSGDESICAVMLLRYLGIQITVDEFIDFFLPQGALRRKDGELLGPDPDEKFVGSPYEKTALGCYPPVIVKALNSCFLQKGIPYRAVDATGLGTDELIAQSLSKGVPALYWASRAMAPTHPGVSWSDPKTGKTYRWTDIMQCMLLVGTDAGELVFNDPMDNNGRRAYNRIMSVKRHQEVGRRAVIVQL